MKNLLTAFLVLGATFCLTAQDQGDKKFFLDVHTLEPGSVTYGEVADAHEKDLATQDAHNVEFIKYWVDEEKGLVYCLSHANKSEDVINTHAEAHGLIPSDIYEVISGKEEAYSGNGYLFLDIHKMEDGVNAKDVEEAHQKDLAEQDNHNVSFINYWVDETNGMVFCLSEAPSKEAVESTHRNAHGLIPVDIIQVKQGQ